MTSNSILKASNLSKTYKIEDRDITVLRGLNITIDRGEFVAVTGSSGSGKTTLLSLLSGLDYPSGGQVWLDGNNITGLTEDKLAPLRNRLIGFVFQSFHLIPSLDALENIMFPAELLKDRNARNRAREMLEQVGLHHRRHNKPDQLSGGEKQRVAICRALINNPRILFADEPTGNLDSANSSEVIELLIRLQEEHGTTLVMATHNLEIAGRADRVIRLHDGVIIDN